MLSQNANEAARMFATDFFNSRQQKPTGLKSTSVEAADLIQTYESTPEANTPIYVFQREGKGFAMVAKYQDDFSIVGYSDEELFQPGNIPPQLSALMKYFEDSLSYMIAGDQIVRANTPVVSPLLYNYGIRLNQFDHAQAGNCPTGCVATAVAQIMLYHAAREGKAIEGYGSHCYTDETYGQICADFSDIKYDSDELLSFHVGVSMEMQYCGSPYGSIPNKDFAAGLENHFNFFTAPADGEHYYIKNELDHQRPVFISLNGDPTGHAFVLDGYDSRGYYHLNFGWGGKCNGFYLLNRSEMIAPDGFYKFYTNIVTPRIITPHPIPVSIEDSLALVAVHHALGGYSATQWDLSKPVYQWPGVLLMNERVIKLSLGISIPASTSQSIAPEIGSLTALRYLSLLGCFNGDIPETIGNLSELRELHLHNNYVVIDGTVHTGNLQGRLPGNIGNLINLEWLSVSNALKGTLPESIGNLQNLQLLRIHQDSVYYGKGNLEGPIPEEIGQLSQLRQLYITHQQLSGPLPEMINNMTGLTDLDLSGNQLEGVVPVLTLPGLEYLRLNGNLLSGIAEGDGDCPNLSDIQLQNNRIEGVIPAYFGHFSSLESMDLSGNQIESLPEEIGNLTRLKNINLDNNQLQALPVGLAIINSLHHLSAANNRISVLPDNLGQSRSLVFLNLSNNQITAIPEEIGNCPDLTQVFFNHNNIASIPESFSNLSDLAAVYLHDNEIEGPIPEPLLTAKGNGKYVSLSENRFVFCDIPQSVDLRFGARNQKDVRLKKSVFKVQLGDTITLDIRDISNLSHPGNQYYWLAYPELLNVTSKDERFFDVTDHPVLKVVINEQTVNNEYYCKVFNPEVPQFQFDYNGSTVTSACIDFLNSESIVFKLASDEEIIAEKYSQEMVTSLEAIQGNSVSDGTVTLVPPLKVKRGEVFWEASADGIAWERISAQMDESLKSNIKEFNSGELVLAPLNTAYYRCGVLELECDPLYSEALKVEAPGHVLYNEIINVEEEGLTISVDSIEVQVPRNFHDQDFRLTITKLDHPPAMPDGVVAGSVYDVTVSFGEAFHTPLLIRLKNIDPSIISDEDIDGFKAVHFNERNQEWEIYDYAYLSLNDSTLAFTTDHLTKLSWWWDTEAVWGYTDVYQRNNIRVFYKYGDLDIMQFGYARKQKKQSWHVADVPLLVQDITEYLPKVMARYKFLGLEVPEGGFKVFVKQMDDAGCVGLLGMVNGYMMIDAKILNPVELRQVLAHEYMHYTQDYYISANPGNVFWMEAHATLSDRMVWNKTEVPLSEAEQVLLDGRSAKTSIFNFLSTPWDYWDKSVVTNNLMGNIHYYYMGSTFLHYMRSYRKNEKKLEPATLLKETSWLGSWRTYLASYTSNHLNAILGDEFEDFIKYILSGENENFTLLNKKGNPFAYIQDPKNNGVFTTPVSYRFKEGDEMVQKDIMNISVPYMASKVVLLENMNPDTMVIVNYQRKHDAHHNYKVYYATYNHLEEAMNFVNISDSTEYNFLLDARNEENAQTKFNNYGFLLFINKNYIGASALIKDFDASFELTAMPMLNMERVSMLNIYKGDTPVTHHFESLTSGGTADPNYIIIGSPKAGYLQNVTEMSVREYQGETTKRIVDDQTYQVNTTYSLVVDQGFIKGMPTMKDSTVYIQTIEHDIKTGIIKISEQEKKIHRLHTFIDYVEVADGVYDENLVYHEYTNFVDDKTKTYWLNDVMIFIQPDHVASGFNEAYGKNIKLFKTDNTADTRYLVSKIEAHYQTTRYQQNGTVSSIEEVRYVSTDYSQPDLKVSLIIQVNDQ